MTWYEKYMKNMVSVYSLNKLVVANRLTQEELNAMIADRLEQFGY